MRFNGFNLNQALCLEALLAERSVSRAAARVHLSQSAMSAVLAQLRDYFHGHNDCRALPQLDAMLVTANLKHFATVTMPHNEYLIEN